MATIKDYIKQYLKWYEEQKEKEVAERKKRVDWYKEKMGSPDKIKNFTEKDLHELIEKLWASEFWQNKAYKVNTLIEDNGLDKIKTEFINLLYSDQPIVNRWDNSIKSIKGLGPSSLSEILTLVFPYQYGIMNTKSLAVLSHLGFLTKEETEKISSGSASGQDYESFIETLQKVREELKNNGLPEADFIDVDLFIWYLFEVQGITYMNFIEFAEKVIREENRPLTPKEIWEIGKSKGYDKGLSSSGKTPWRTIGAKLYVDIRDNPSTKFIKLKPERRPVSFYLKDLGNINKYITGEIPIKEEQKFKYKERDLHKYLSYFLYNNSFIYTKTIFHEKSSKNKNTYSQWLHPDVVGVYLPIGEWESEILEISKDIGSIRMKLFSYEIKKELNLSNLRESYFQAVSNSSWANEGYLVAADIETDEEFLKELSRLTNSFGIGIIRLDIDDPDSSEIMYPAKEKDIVDIETMNKIAKVNPDFKEFLKRVEYDLATKEIRKEKYDKIYDIDDLINKKGLE